jgi:sulfate/thiosulfate transport system substrate-binding protein
MGRRGLDLGVAVVILVSLALLLASCGGGTEDAASGAAGEELKLVGYPGLDSAYQKALEPAFEKSLAGEGVSFSNSFGASEELSRAVAEGQPASIVNFEQAGEMERLVEAGKVDANWDKQPIFYGIAHYSVIVFVVRKDNPKQVHNIDDLMRNDVNVIVPNPFRSDAGRWGVMDVYATLIHERKSEAEALAGVRSLLGKAVSQPDSAPEALDMFLRGQGDVLLTYESEAIKAVEEGKGKRFHFVVPHQTILVEAPIAVTVEAPEPAARNFLKFLWSEAGYLLWAKAGYRPVDQLFVDQERFFPRETLKIGRFGGWGKVNEEFFDSESGSVAKIEKELGVPTSG